MAKITISEETWGKIRRKSPAFLPDNPTAMGWSAEEIRQQLYRFVLDDSNSIKALIMELAEGTDIDEETVRDIVTEILGDYEPGEGGGGDVSTEAMNKAIAAAIQEHNEQIQVHPNRIDPMEAELSAIKQTVSGLTAEKVGADPAGTAATKVSEHDTYTGSHNDIRLLIQGLSDRLNALANSDDTTLDDLKEIVTYIKANKSLIDSITTSKVSVADIIDNLTTNVNNRPLSAAQGVALKNLIDALGNSKLDASALGAAVDQALLIAKESGEFKGDKGDTGSQGPKGDPYTLTETDKAAIVAQVIETLGGEPIFGYVDEENNIIVQGNLADGTYTVKYEMTDGSTVSIGNLVLDSNVYYSITNNLTNCTNSNSATTITEGSAYSATITAHSGYELSSVSVTMGGSAVSVSGGVINIASVTGDIVITAVAEEVVVPSEPKNFAEYNADNTSDWSIWINNARASSDGVYRSDTYSADYGTPVVSNYIAVQNGDIVEFSGIYAANKNCVLYNSDESVLQAAVVTNMTSYLSDISLDGAAYSGQFTVNSSSVAFVRIGGYISLDDFTVSIKIKRNGAWLTDEDEEIVNLAVPNDIAGSEAQWNTGEWCNDSYMSSGYEYRSATDGRATTNIFAAEKGDIVYVKGITYTETGSFPQIAIFDSNKNYESHKNARDAVTNSFISGLTKISDDYWCFTHASNVAHYFRLAGYLSGTANDVIITANQPIA